MVTSQCDTWLIYFSQVLKGWWYEYELWAGHRYYLHYIPCKTCLDFFLFEWYQEYTKISSLIFLPQVFLLFHTLTKMMTSVVSVPPPLFSEHIWEHLALSVQLLLALRLIWVKTGATYRFSLHACDYCLLWRCPCVLERTYCPCSAWRESKQRCRAEEW